MSDIQADIGAGIVAVMQADATFDAFLGDAGASQHSEYVLNRTYKGDSGRCIVRPGPAAQLTEYQAPASGTDYAITAYQFQVTFELFKRADQEDEVTLTQRAIQKTFGEIDGATLFAQVSNSDISGKAFGIDIDTTVTAAQLLANGFLDGSPDRPVVAVAMTVTTTHKRVQS